jgi:hypothetical protein
MRLVQYRQRRSVFCSDVLSNSHCLSALKTSVLWLLVSVNRSRRSDAKRTSPGSHNLVQECWLHLEVGVSPPRTGVVK